MGNRRLTDGPWAWLKLGNEYHLVASYGSRRVILTRAETCNQEGILEPATPDSADMRLISESRSMYDLLTRVLESNGFNDANLRNEIDLTLGRIR